jgi:uncharacterized protein (DUF885 family)
MNPLKPLLPLLCLGLACLPAPVRAADETARLHDLFHREWEYRLKEDPLFATTVGRHEYNDRLPDISTEDLARRAAAGKAFLAELAAIDRTTLSNLDAVNYDIFRGQLADGIASWELGEDQLPFNADSGFHSEFSRLPEVVPLVTAKDYDNYISRLRAWPRYVDQEIEQMRLGLKRGLTVPRAVLNGFDSSITPYIVESPEKSGFWKPFERFPSTIPEAERERLRKEGRQAVAEGAIPGYRKFLDFYRKEYLPGTRTTIAAADLPNGRAFYAQQIRHYTTLTLSPEEIHKIGLAEVDRIAKEMDAVMKQTGFTGDFAAFVQFLRTDPRFYAKTPQALLERAAWIAKTIDGKLPSLFKTLPRLPYTVQPVPDAIAPKYTSGRYVESPQGSTQPGIYWVNIYKVETRPLYNLEALTLHEAVPGHHLQIAISRELSDLPDFRRYSYISAFGEGWGLYSEWLGQEAGVYTDAYSNFGRLSYEMWRACRLVVDTGVHAKGWTRQQALDYLGSHTALPLHEVETEVDRYISWPGQALAYKLGELKIKELRRRSEQTLGPRFDLRDFHDVVLGSGAVPLDVLEKNVNAWIEQRRGDAAVGR